MASFESINIHIQRTPHVTATDFDFLDSMVKDPQFNIYAPELDGTDESVLKGMRKIAAGDSKVYRDVMSRTDKGSAWAQSFSALFMLKKPIESFDVTYEQYQSNPVLRNFGNVGLNLSTLRAQELIDEMPEQLQRLPAFIQARDTVIAQNIVERLPGIIDENPRLRSLGSVGMLMTIGDNHVLVDKILTDLGFTVTTNEIPVVGAHEKAGLKLLNGEHSTEQEIMEAAAYTITRNFVSHDSTYELRKSLNAFAEGVQKHDLDTILSTIRTHGVPGLQRLFEYKIGDHDLRFSTPGSIPPPIQMKETFERRNGQMGIRTGIF